MKLTSLISTAFAAALTSSAVLAADLPVTKGPPPAPVSFLAPFTWAGLYVGLEAGYANSGLRATRTPGGPTFSSNANGVYGGLLAGVNFQSNAFVFGLEADDGFMSGKGSNTNAGAATLATMESREKFSGRIRGRLGYAFDRTLLFAAGGFSLANEEVRLINTAGVPGSGGKISRNLIGYNLGAGVDYAFTNNWVARLEYVHDFYAAKTYPFAAVTAGFFGNRKVKLNDDLVRAALIYKF